MQTPVESAFDERTVDGLAADGYVVVDDWLGHAVAVALRAHLISLIDLGCFATARVGAGAGRQEAVGARGDSVCWFDPGAGPGARDGRLGVLPGRLVGVCALCASAPCEAGSKGQAYDAGDLRSVRVCFISSAAG